MWKFAEGFDPVRKARLLAVPSFDWIVERISLEMAHVWAEIARGASGKVLDCKRPEFGFQVSRNTFDAFFNSPVGLRAQYLHDATDGQAATRKAIDRISERLVDALRPGSGPHDMDCAAVRVSLAAPSAKIWVDEVHAAALSTGRDLEICTWMASAILGVEKAHRGLLAPEGDLIQVKGAFLTELDEERIPSDKVGRALEIHCCGYS